MTFNTFSSGVNTSFSSQLNSNFRILDNAYIENMGNHDLFNMNSGKSFVPSSAAFNLMSFAVSESNISSGVVSSVGGFSCVSSTLPVGQTVSSAFIHYDYSVHAQLNEAGVSVSGAATSTDTVDLSSQYFVSWKYDLSAGATGQADLILTDGTSSVTLVNKTSPYNAELGIMQMFIDWANKNVVVTKYPLTYNRDSAGDLASFNQQPSTTSYSIAGFTSLKLRVQGGAGGDSASFSKVRGLKLSPSSTVTLKASSDGGSNYTTLANNPDVVIFGTASSNLKFQFSGYLASSTEVVELERIYFKILG